MGWKYNMSNIEAALLLPQFDRLGKKLTYRQELAERYVAGFSGCEKVQVLTQKVSKDTVHAHHVFPIRVPAELRDKLISHLQSLDIGCVVNYRPIHIMKFFKEKYGFEVGDFPVSERIGNEVISLPFYPGMPFQDVDVVVDEVTKFL